MKERALQYIAIWKERGYSDGIPDEVPSGLMAEGLAPSYKAICLAILKNDHSMTSLGFGRSKSRWYDELKRIELDRRRAEGQGVKLRDRSQIDWIYDGLERPTPAHASLTPASASAEDES